MTMKYVLTFSVAPYKTRRRDVPPEFPLDMLRHDACFPATQRDVVRMASCADYGSRIRLVAACGGELKIKLRSYRPDKRSAPTRARWRPYGWKVLELEWKQL